MQKLTSPRLSTIKMVEDRLKENDHSLITLAELKRTLPKQVNHNTLITILEYLEESGKIATSLKGITWTYNPSFKLNKAIQKGFQH